MTAEVLEGLAQTPKRLPSKFFYDGAGSALFERICELDAYYPTRTEVGILERHGAEMAAQIGPGALVIEPGSGSGVKTELLLRALEAPAGCVLIDISREHLLASAERLGEQFPEIDVVPVEADFTRDVDIPRLDARRAVVFYPGSTIGNFDRRGAERFLARMAELVGPGGGLLIGVDLVKERSVLELAYDDPQGVTAAFNRNLLVHLNREIGTDFDPARFEHVALWNAEASRIEMHLESRGPQTVRVGDAQIHLSDRERICTEHSNKYRLDQFASLAAAAGWRTDKVWTDRRGWFSVQSLSVSAESRGFLGSRPNDGV
ncbi:MAG: L-histidine N(alpha)-methyltransferase [Acidobacteriota bacterium]